MQNLMIINAALSNINAEQAAVTLHSRVQQINTKLNRNILKSKCERDARRSKKKIILNNCFYHRATGVAQFENLFLFKQKSSLDS